MAYETLEDIENCMNNGWTDGLPVIPPYGSVVGEMLDAMGWKADDVIGEFPEHNLVVRAEQAAATAVMAGCANQYGSLLRSLSEALLDPKLNICGAEVTTGGASLLVIVSGPAVAQHGFEHKENALGANNRANATVGRFAQMMRLFCGRAGGVLQTHGTIGHPGRISFCVAEHPETEWGAYHTQFGISEEASAVSVMSTEGPNSCNNHYGDTAAHILDTIGDCMCHYGQTAWYYRSGGFVVVLPPDHMALVSKEFGRDEARTYIYEHARRQTDDLARMGRIAKEPIEFTEVVPGEMRSPLKSPDQLTFIECGAAGGRFSAVIPRWVGSTHIVTRQIEDKILPPSPKRTEENAK